MKVLVTGAGGFVGYEVVKNLRSKGFDVRGLIRNPKQKEKLEKLGAEVILGDITDEKTINDAVKGVSKVYHIAALFRQAGLPDQEYTRVNVDATKLLLDASVQQGVEKFIYCSTNGVHGDIDNPPANENAPYNPGDVYQVSKLEAEKIVIQYAKSGKINASVIRPAMIYGPGDDRFLKLFKGIAEGKFFYVGKGEALVHFIDVRDLAEAFYLLGERKDLAGEAFLIAGKTYSTLKEVCGKIAKLLGVKPPWLHLPVRPMQILGSICEAICTPLKINPPIFRRRVDFFIKNRCFDCSKAQNILGFKPMKNLDQELVEIIDSYVKDGKIKTKASGCC